MPITVVTPSSTETVQLTGDEDVLVRTAFVDMVSVSGRYNTLIADAIDTLAFIDGADRNAVYADSIESVTAINSNLFNSSLTIDVLGRINRLEADNQIRLDVDARRINSLDIDVFRNSSLEVDILKRGIIENGGEDSAISIARLIKKLEVRDIDGVDIEIGDASRARVILDRVTGDVAIDEVNFLNVERTPSIEVNQANVIVSEQFRLTDVTGFTNTVETFDHVIQSVTGGFYRTYNAVLIERVFGTLEIGGGESTTDITNANNATLIVGDGVSIDTMRNGILRTDDGFAEIGNANGTLIEIDAVGYEADEAGVIKVQTGSVTLNTTTGSALFRFELGDGDDDVRLNAVTLEEESTLGTGSDSVLVRGGATLLNANDGVEDTLIYVAASGGDHTLEADTQDQILIRRGGTDRTLDEFDTDDDGQVTFENGFVLIVTFDDSAL